MSVLKSAQGIRAFAASLLVVFCFGAAGEICGAFFETTAAAFDSKFPDNRLEDLKLVLDKLGTPKDATGVENSTGNPVVVMVVDEDPRKIVAENPKSGEVLWETAISVRSELTVAGDLVVLQSGFEVVGLDLMDGHRLWGIEIDEGWDYHGADVDGDLAVISVGVGGKEAGAYANGRLICLDAKGGGKNWDISSGGGLLGTPAVYGGLVFVPWDRQKLAILDAIEGEEICRLRADDYTINYVRAEPEGVFYGSAPTATSLASLFRLDDKSATGTREGSTVFTPDLEPVPGDPGFERDAFATPVGGRSAAEKILFHWRPSTTSEEPVGENVYYLHYWRYVIAFDASSNQVLWTFRSDTDLESMTAVDGGVVAVDSNGRIVFVDAATGADSTVHDTGRKALTAAFDVNGTAPEAAAAAASDPLVGLKELIWDKDNRMLPIRAYSAFLMASIPVPEVTRDLLAIYADASITKGLRDSVVQALKKRTAGSQYLVEALHMKYDFLEQTQAPPMDVVSPALVNMNDRSAVPGLLGHLMDHETPVEALRDIAMAIHELGDPSVVGTLSQFMTLYHADSSFIGHEDALAMVARGILKFGGQTNEPQVAHIRDDPQTLPELKSQLLEILDPEAAAKAAAEAARAAADAAEAQAEAAAQAEANRAAQEAASRPRNLPRDVISQVIADNQEVLKPCVQSALGINPNVRTIRMNFIITGETGKSSNLQVLPANIPGLATCLTNGLNAIEFPLFKDLRQKATYIIKIEGVAPAPGYGYPTQPSQGGQPSRYDPDSFGGPGGFQQQPQQPQQPQPRQPQGQPTDPDAF